MEIHLSIRAIKLKKVSKRYFPKNRFNWLGSLKRGRKNIVLGTLSPRYLSTRVSPLANTSLLFAMFAGVFTEEDLKNMSYVLCYHCGTKLVPLYKTKLSYFAMSLKHGDTCDPNSTIYPCPFCSYQGKYKYHYKTHIKIHLNIKPYLCKYCGRAFSHKASRDAHLNIHTGLKPFLCLICGQSFRTFTLMKRHTLCDHHNIRNYLCSYCNRTYKDKKTLDNHILKHIDMKPHACHFKGCNVSCRQLSNLLSHIRIYHTGERPFKCKFCEYAFKERHHLDMHINLHIGRTVRYKCNCCTYSAASEWNLEQHSRIHRNERPFPCAYCSKAFRQKVHCQIHMRTIHRVSITRRTILWHCTMILNKTVIYPS